jgi:SAM-dependent methyltransferase
MILPDSSILTNICFSGNENPGNTLFEKKYITIRCMENRLYSDDEVAHLPDISPEHPYYKEWLVRKRSSQRLVRYLTEQKKRLHILEAGCGNGWLAHCLSEIPGTEVLGLDINFTELQQAARVFSQNEHLRFIYGDMSSGVLHNRLFDAIVFAASIQYFRSLSGILSTCLKMLKPDGEIHIIDSPLYRSREIGKAVERTFRYYDSLGYPEMSDHYFHHDVNIFWKFNYKFLQNPNSVFNTFLGRKDCFHWIRVKK